MYFLCSMLSCNCHKLTRKICKHCKIIDNVKNLSCLFTDISLVPKFVLSFIKIAFAPKFFANSTSVKRSPITKEFSKSYSSVKYLVNKPVFGFGVNTETGSGWLLQQHERKRPSSERAKQFVGHCQNNNESGHHKLNNVQPAVARRVTAFCSTTGYATGRIRVSHTGHAVWR